MISIKENQIKKFNNLEKYFTNKNWTVIREDEISLITFRLSKKFDIEILIQEINNEFDVSIEVSKIFNDGLDYNSQIEKRYENINGEKIYNLILKLNQINNESIEKVI